jgi:hypothetical protein
MKASQVPGQGFGSPRWMMRLPSVVLVRVLELLVRDRVLVWWGEKRALTLCGKMLSHAHRLSRRCLCSFFRV